MQGAAHVLLLSWVLVSCLSARMAISHVGPSNPKPKTLKPSTREPPNPQSSIPVSSDQGRGQEQPARPPEAESGFLGRGSRRVLYGSRGS